MSHPPLWLDLLPRDASVQIAKHVIKCRGWIPYAPGKVQFYYTATVVSPCAIYLSTVSLNQRRAVSNAVSTHLDTTHLLSAGSWQREANVHIVFARLRSLYSNTNVFPYDLMVSLLKAPHLKSVDIITSGDFLRRIPRVSRAIRSLTLRFHAAPKWIDLIAALCKFPSGLKQLKFSCKLFVENGCPCTSRAQQSYFLRCLNMLFADLEDLSFRKMKCTHEQINNFSLGDALDRLSSEIMPRVRQSFLARNQVMRSNQALDNLEMEGGPMEYKNLEEQLEDGGKRLTSLDQRMLLEGRHLSRLRLCSGLKELTITLLPSAEWALPDLLRSLTALEKIFIQWSVRGCSHDGMENCIQYGRHVPRRGLFSTAFRSSKSLKEIAFSAVDFEQRDLDEILEALGDRLRVFILDLIQYGSRRLSAFEEMIYGLLKHNPNFEKLQLGSPFRKSQFADLFRHSIFPETETETFPRVRAEKLLWAVDRLRSSPNVIENEDILIFREKLSSLVTNWGVAHGQQVVQVQQENMM